MKILVTYYSRSGVTRKAADKIAEYLQQKGCEVALEEIADKTSRKGITGWLRGVRDAMLHKPTIIEPLQNDPAQFDIVIAGTPVWAFTAAPAAVEALTKMAAGIKDAAFFCTMGGSGDKGTFEAMEKSAGKKPLARLVLIDKKVKNDDPDEFVTKVQAFVDTMLSAGEDN